eukprot:6799189-Pyramimonas_sp.AAC.1
MPLVGFIERIHSSLGDLHAARRLVPPAPLFCWYAGTGQFFLRLSPWSPTPPAHPRKTRRCNTQTTCSLHLPRMIFHAPVAQHASLFSTAIQPFQYQVAGVMCKISLTEGT